MSDSYEDIINLPHPTSAKHRRMANADRAAQFAPFAALTGLGAAINETARLTDARTELSEDKLAMLNETLRAVLEQPGGNPTVLITCFEPDAKKDGGAYITVKGRIRRLDEYERVIIMSDGKRLPLDDITEIDTEC